MNAFLNLRVLRAVGCAAIADADARREYLRGVRVEVTPRHVTYIATDGHVLLAHRETAPSDGPDNTLIGQWTVPLDVCLAPKLPTRGDRFTDLGCMTRDADDETRLYLEWVSGGRRFQFSPVDGAFCAWRRVVPGRNNMPSGKPGTYAPAKLMQLQKAATILDKTVGPPDILQDPSGPSLVRWHALPDSIGVLMPVRSNGFPGLPEWLESPDAV